jgi:heat shock protein HtpX
MYSSIAANKRTTWFLALIFIAIITALAYVIGLYYGGSSDHGYYITAFAILGSGIYALVQYFLASKLALAVNGAQEISRNDYPEYYRVVENLSITTGTPMPKVYVMQDQAPNAFATGRDPKHAAVCATTGLLEIMNKSELEAVMAHEMGHVQNYDIRVSMIVFGLVSIIGLLADVIMRMFIFGGNDRDRNVNPIFIVIGIVAAIITPIVASLVQLAVSRRREYLADSTGVLTTRYPEGLISALQKLEQYGRPMKRQNSSTAHLFFSNPLKSGGLAQLFSTHPPIEDRIARLREQALKA